MTVKVEFDKTGQPVGVDGAHAVTVNVDTGHSPGKLHVRFTARSIGDDSLYAGSIEGHFILTAPTKFPGVDPSEQAKAAADYTRHMIDAMEHVVSEDLATAFVNAAKDANEHGDHETDPDAKLDFSKIVEVIAMTLVLLNKGDEKAAKADALRFAYGEKVHDIDAPPTMSDLTAQDRHELITLLNAAIDAI
jgi:hypothetical protein